MFKRLLSLFILWACSLTILYAQSAPNLAGKTQSFYNTTIKPLFPWVILIVFVVTALFNIGDLMGEQRDYKRFFTRIGLFVGGTMLVIAVVNYLATLSL